MQATLSVGQVITWVLIVMGFFVTGGVTYASNIRQSNEADIKRRALEVVGLVEEIEKDSISYWMEGNDGRQSGSRLGEDIKSMLQEADSKISALEELYNFSYPEFQIVEFRQACTGESFEVSSRVPEAPDSEKIMMIRSKSKGLRESIEDSLSRKRYSIWKKRRSS